MEIVKLIGSDILPDDQKLIIEMAKVVREGYLQQNAFHAADTYTPPEKQMTMLRIILHLYSKAKVLTENSIPLRELTATGIFSEISKMKFELGDTRDEEYFIKRIDEAVGAVKSENV